MGGETVTHERLGDTTRPFDVVGPTRHRGELVVDDGTGAERVDQSSPALTVRPLEP